MCVCVCVCVCVSFLIKTSIPYTPGFIFRLTLQYTLRFYISVKKTSSDFPTGPAAKTVLGGSGMHNSCGSVVVALGLSCSETCGIFLDQGLNPCPLCIGRQVLIHCTIRDTILVVLNGHFSYDE